MGFLGSSAGIESACNARDPGSIPGLGRSLEKGSATHSSILGFPWCSDGKESTCNAGDLSSIPGLERSPGEGNGYTHSSILAWRIPWTEEPGRLQSMESHKESDMTKQLSLSKGR